MTNDEYFLVKYVDPLMDAIRAINDQDERLNDTLLRRLILTTLREVESDARNRVCGLVQRLSIDIHTLRYPDA